MVSLTPATLAGTTFTPVQQVAAIGVATDALKYPLYLTSNKKGIGTGPWVEYQWDTGTYFLSNVTDSTGAPSAAQITSAVSAFGLKGDETAQYVVASKANGFVLTDSGGGNPMVLRTLAAAYAETGSYGQAAVTARRALELAVAEKQDALAATLQKEIKLYEADTPQRNAQR